MKTRGVPISLRLALLSAVATALVVSATFLALQARVQADIRREFADELNASQQSLRSQQDRNLRLLLATSSLVSTSPTLRAALQTWRVEGNSGLPTRTDLLATIQREVEIVFADLDQDMLTVTDEAGNVLAAAVRNGTPRPRANLFGLASVRHALVADTITADSSFGVLKETAGERTIALQVGCVAIMVGGYPIGVLVLGKRLDHLLPEFAEAPGTEALITVGDTVLMSTTEAVRPGSQWLETASTRASSWRTRLAGEEFVGTTLPLGLAATGEPARMHLVRSLSASVVPVTNAMRGSFLLFGILAVLVAGAGAALVSRTSLRPLARFVGFMRTGAEAGAYASYADPEAPAEIATLTEAYNHLIDSLGQQHKQLRASQEQLRQSQKLEAVGTLAGGIAHDFNNLLSVIMGYTQLSIDELPKDHPVRADLESIAQASERAHGLVRQLLAFSRKQVLQPKLLDVNEVMRGLGKLMQPLIGEDVEVRMNLAPEVARIMADRGQIEQVLVNLVVNARDAMPTGGTITIETGNVDLDDRPGDQIDVLPGGPAVMVAVSDTGSGMDAAVRDRIFEPFFTTKEAGKGTGLGLSTVYGIIKQSGGNITVYSEPGQGTTFRMYFPVAARADVEAAVTDETTDGSRGHETVLLAEDDAQLRSLVRRCLVARGYVVLEASHGEEALHIAGHHTGPIHLLLTDVVMPNTSGRALAERLVAERPNMRVLFMSGHSDEAVARHGVLTSTSAFIQKPVLPDALTRIVREVLDSDPVGHI